MAEKPERESDGRWKKGCASPNPGGRTRRDQADAYWNILISTLTNEAWRAIVAKAVEQARAGDRHARKFLADYGIGTPEQRLALSSAEGAEINVRYVNNWRGGDSAPE